ncbi:DUF4873 domain-containing protein [Nocardioides maradonensis]
MSRPKARREPFVPPAEDEGYRGPALLVVGETALEVDVDLADHFEPLDGRTHWYGRIQAAPAVDALKTGGATSGELRIGSLSAAVRLAEHDPWGNVAVTGVGAPPYDEISPAR